MYYSDHERAPNASGDGHERVYLNTAKYIKVGQNMWVDRRFTSCVLSGMYTFHASAAAFSDFFNDSLTSAANVTRRNIWQAFVQESIHFISSNLNTNLTLQDNLSIDEVTRQAFDILGEDGMIRAADQHACKECTHEYRASADVILSSDIPQMVVIDDDDSDDDYEDLGEDDDDDDDDDDDGSDDNDESNVESDDIHTYHAPVKMVVMDGIVIGHPHCAHNNCTNDLQNARGGIYCALHENRYGGLCHMANCSNVKVEGTQACEQHQQAWERFLVNHRQHALGGYRRALRRPDESLPWMPRLSINVQPHDENQERQRRANNFTPPRFYCIETICAPCGVVIAWAKFAKSESPANIMSFLGKVYPTEESRPSYVCIDKACLVLRSCVRNGNWNDWKKTTRFVVDTYHYSNHNATDQLCQKYCNPAPTDGSAPNLVITDRTASGQIYYKRAFNTQACEQLNAWLGGFEQILKRMTAGNFNWFLHTMLTYHTKHVIHKQSLKRKSRAHNLNEEGSDN